MTQSGDKATWIMSFGFSVLYFISALCFGFKYWYSEQN